jgi:hypothetical protein
MGVYPVRKRKNEMFTIEQNIAKSARKNQKKRFLRTGIPLAKDVSVKYRITYKEITVILGIAVAILVALTLWVIHPAEQQASHAACFPGLFSQPLAKGFIYTLADLIF